MTIRGLRALVILAAVSALSQGAAAQNCDRPETVPEMTECATLRFRAADRELADVYGALLDSEDKDFTQAVKEAQEAWMRWREAEGRLMAKTVADPALAGYAAKNQQAQMTEDRVKDLRSISEH